MVMKKLIKAGAVAGAAAAGAVIWKRAVPPPRIPAYPVPDGSVTAERARGLAAELATATEVGKRDVAIAFATSSATSVDPLLHGTEYFPPMLEAIRGAKTSVSLLMYGYKPGDIADDFTEALIDALDRGCAVRLAVDAIGSEVRFGSKELFAEIVDAGIAVVMNRGMMPDVVGDLGGDGRIGWSLGDIGHFDHRKMMIVDGRVAFLGGTGIEDHFNDERFYDVMVRVEGPIVAQLQALFVAGWRHQGGSLPDDGATMDALFPPLAEAGPDAVPTTVLVNVPGTGHYPISEAIETLMERAQRRIDIVNPYISDRRLIDRLVDAANRGVQVRIVVPGKPTPPFPAAAFRHNYPRLLEAGVTIVAHPDMAHAKVMVADDSALIGGCNFDGLSLYQNWELDLLFDDAAVAQAVSEKIVDRFAAVATPVEVTTDPKTQLWNAAMDRISPLL